jgi:type II secretory pathway pseudopilin PulG
VTRCSLRRSEELPTSAGVSLIELVLVAAMVAVMTGVAVPWLLDAIGQARAAAAARLLAADVQGARMEAVKRAAFVGLRFEHDQAGYLYGTYVDGNGNGIRTADISRQIDIRLGVERRLAAHFTGVDLGVADGVPDIDTGQLLPGDPVRLGRTDILSFSPLGSSTSGTLYVLGRGPCQLAVRVLGVTGRVRVLRYDFNRREWVAP